MSVLTAIRILPEKPDDDSWYRLNANTIIRKDKDNSTKELSFDQVYEDHTTADVYNGACREMVNSILDGYNVAIAAYGQSGSGKTHSILGNATENGIASLAVEHLLQEISKRSPVQYIVKMSCFEIYNEKLYDLLDANTTKTCRVAEDGVNGAIESHIASFEHFSQLSAFAQDRRRVGETHLNNKSSRSHAVYQFVVESLENDQATGRQLTTFSRLLILDLAGSENARALVSKKQTTESRNINLSLLALSKLISTIADESSDQKFLSFRESILTRILQPAIGGNSKLFLLGCIRRKNSNETNSTLSFCSKAKFIKNDVKKNEQIKNAELPKLLEQITLLKKQLEEKENLQMQEDERKQRLDRLMQLVLNSNQSVEAAPGQKENAVKSTKVRRRHSISTFGMSSSSSNRQKPTFVDDWNSSLFCVKEEEDDLDLLVDPEKQFSVESGRSSRLSMMSDITEQSSRPPTPESLIACATQTDGLVVDKEIYDELLKQVDEMKKSIGEMEKVVEQGVDKFGQLEAENKQLKETMAERVAENEKLKEKLTQNDEQEMLKLAAENEELKAKLDQKLLKESLKLTAEIEDLRANFSRDSAEVAAENEELKKSLERIEQEKAKMAEELERISKISESDQKKESEKLEELKKSLEEEKKRADQLEQKIAEKTKTATVFKAKWQDQIEKYDDMKSQGLEILKKAKMEKEEAELKLERVEQEKKEVLKKLEEERDGREAKSRTIAELNSMILRVAEEEKIKKRRLAKMDEELRRGREERQMLREELAETRIKSKVWTKTEHSQCNNKEHVLLEVDIRILENHKEMLINRLNERSLE